MVREWTVDDLAAVMNKAKYWDMYYPHWLISRTLLMRVRKLKGKTGRFIWQCGTDDQGTDPGNFARLMGLPYVETTGGENVAIVFDRGDSYGDGFRRGIVTL